MSTMKSSTAPATQVTYLAWPGGTSAKWMPRTVPRAETEMLVCASSQRVADDLGEPVDAEPLEEDARARRGAGAG